MGHRFFEHTADVGIEVTATTMPLLFSSAGEALCECMVDRSTIHPAISRTFTVSANSQEELLQRFLSQLLLYFAINEEVFSVIDVHDIRDHTACATVQGERFDAARHTLKTEIKAVTYHQLAIVAQHGMLTARIIVDV